LNAEEWHKLPQKWKDDADIACAVFANKNCANKIRKITNGINTTSRQMGRSLEFLDLPYHLCIQKEIVLHALRSQCTEFQDIPLKFKSDADIIASAILYGKIKYEDTPTDLQRTRNCFLRCI